VTQLLYVKTPQEALETILDAFKDCRMPAERLLISDALGRTLAEDVRAAEYVPDFSRSTVDGYAAYARDTFGCSESIPAILPLKGDIKMGAAAETALAAGTCVSVPTGGDVPAGADAVVMLEYAEDYGDGTIGITKPAAPGENLIFRGDDLKPGDVLLPAGRVLTPHGIGALAAAGIAEFFVSARPLVGIISTGDELVSFDVTPKKGQIRDVNTILLASAVKEAGGAVKTYGIVRDDEETLLEGVRTSLRSCDLVLISGGSSVGMKDATARVIEKNGDILFHGIAMKPGKPTILGQADGKPVFGLPGHPVAAYFVTQLFVRPLLALMSGRSEKSFPVEARLSEAVSSNHGRAEYLAVVLTAAGGLSDAIPDARPIRAKSGLITSLSSSDGYICIPRDCEGLPKGAAVPVTLWNRI
jgi:molybdopterin molybdotransferase